MPGTSFPFASAQRQRSRGEGQDEGRHGRRLIYPLAGRDERLRLPAKAFPVWRIRNPSPGHTPKSLHDFRVWSVFDRTVL